MNYNHNDWLFLNDSFAQHWIHEKCKSLHGELASISCLTRVLVSAYLRSTISESKLKSCVKLAHDVRNRLGFAEGEEVTQSASAYFAHSPFFQQSDIEFELWQGLEELGDCFYKIVNDESICTVTSTLVDALKVCKANAKLTLLDV